MKTLHALLAASMLLSGLAAADMPKGAGKTIKAIYKACKDQDLASAQALIAPELSEEFARTNMCSVLAEEFRISENADWHSLNRKDGVKRAIFYGEDCLVGRGWFSGVCVPKHQREFELACEGKACKVTKIGELHQLSY